MRPSVPVLASSVLALLALACGSEGAAAEGGPPGKGPTTAFEPPLGASCERLGGTGAFTKVTDEAVRADLGGCGHVAWTDAAGTLRVVDPTLAHTSEVGTFVERFAFSPSGRYLLAKPATDGPPATDVYALADGSHRSVPLDLTNVFPTLVGANDATGRIEVALDCALAGGLATYALATGARTEVTSTPCHHVGGFWTYGVAVVGEGTARSLSIVRVLDGEHRTLELPPLPTAASPNESWTDGLVVTSLGRLAIYTQRRSVASGDTVVQVETRTVLVDLVRGERLEADGTLDVRYSDGVTAFLAPVGQGTAGGPSPRAVFSLWGTELFGPLVGEPRGVLDRGSEAPVGVLRAAGEGGRSVVLVDVTRGTVRDTFEDATDVLLSPASTAAAIVAGGRIQVARAGSRRDVGAAGLLETVSEGGLVAVAERDQAGRVAGYRVIREGDELVATSTARPIFVTAGGRDVVVHDVAQRAESPEQVAEVVEASGTLRELVRGASVFARGTGDRALVFVSDVRLEPGTPSTGPKRLYAGAP